MQAFREVIGYCHFQQLLMDGSFFTWSNMQEGDTNIQERLDQFFATIDWLTLFPSPQVLSFPTSYSNHICLILNIIGLVEVSRQSKKPFRFEAIWIGADGCDDVISEFWSDRVEFDTVKTLEYALCLCSHNLDDRKHIHFGNI